MKYLAGCLIAFSALIVFSCAVPEPNNGVASSSPYSGNPELVITSYPAYGSGNVVYGYLTNGNPSLYKICCWINVGSATSWWPKNTYVNWNITIPTNCSWAYDFYSYPTDVNAWRLIFFLLPIDYPSSADIYTLARDSITYTVLNRVDSTAPQISVSNAVSNVITVYHVTDYTNINVIFRVSDDYYLDGVGIARDTMNFDYFRTEKTTIFTQTTNVEIAFCMHTGTNFFRYFAKDQNAHYSATNELIVNCVPFRLPEISCNLYTCPYVFSSPYNVTGTAYADAGVSNVFAFTNGVPIPVTGTTNWTATVTAELGHTTVFTMYCIDNYGLSSLTQSTIVHYGFDQPPKTY